MLMAAVSAISMKLSRKSRIIMLKNTELDSFMYFALNLYGIDVSLKCLTSGTDK